MISTRRSNAYIIILMSDTDTLRNYLKLIAKGGQPVLYRDAAKALRLEPPNTIHRLALMLESLIEEDARNNAPLIAALVISKQRNGLPAPGFFAKAREMGLYDGPESGDQAREFHRHQFQQALEYWSEQSA